jgi:aromatic ring-opening dioxygenase catalytic subunit (LigB family)
MTTAAQSNQIQIVYFSHGGGPLPILGDRSHQAMIDFMKRLSKEIPQPDAILVISAHWEERVPTLLGAASPPLYYDYYGFPEAAYELTYPLPGNLALNHTLAGLFDEAELPYGVNPQRGFDHGVFIPLMMMYPEADIPTAQLSLVQGLDPALHLQLGHLLRGIDNLNLLVIGSGFSYHNLHAFFNPGGDGADPKNEAFQDWLIETCTSDITPSEREGRLTAWEKAPNARYCHPRAEHLMPLQVCAGLAGRPGEVVFDDQILNKRAVAFYWSP